MIKDKKAFLIKALQHLGVIVFFLFTTIVYFSPEFFDGKTLPQHDVSQFEGSSQDIRQLYNDEGESSAWTGGMFSGMPAYQIGIWGGSPNFLNYVEAPMKALGGSTAGPVFTGMLMAYILFLILGFNIPMAMFGAIAYSLSSYNIIILDAGHVTKAWALAYMPIVVAGILAMYRNKILVGGLCMALGLALQIKNNHLQMTYYTAILCAILYIGLVIKQIRAKEFPNLLKSSGILAIAVVLALLANAGNIYANYEMSETSTRGKSELTSDASGQGKQTDGLDKDYVFGWSYGKGETLSLLIPDIHGGASVTRMGSSSHLHKAMEDNGYGAQIDKKGMQGYTYWGEQPITSGPVYLGAVVCFLFLLGMLIIRNPLKWIFLGASVFFIFLAWGKNFESFNDLFYNYFPIYSKFRAVSQALVIPTLLIIIVAVWAIRDFFGGGIEKEKLLKSLYTAAGITGGLCLFFWVVPDFFFNFTSVNDAAWKEQMPEWFYKATLLDRKSMLSSDALRSLIFIILAAGAMWFSLKKKNTKDIAVYVTSILIILTLVDLWTVDRRYLNDDKFVTQQQQSTFKKTPADEAILDDRDNFRVLELNNPFNETRTSYFHRSIGGYHAAKLQRYQQLIERRLSAELNNIYASFESQDINHIISALEKNTALNMLNTRYIVFDLNQQPLINPFAMGNAWFVEDYKLVKNADEEIAALNFINPVKEAVIDERFYGEVKGYSFLPDSTASIELTEYTSNELTYKSSAKTDQLAVFSEIYYPNGWNAYLDGKLVPHFRTDWTLRGMVVPAGDHEIVFRFEPKGYYNSRMLATASSALLILLLLGTIIYQFVRTKDEKAIS